MSEKSMNNEEFREILSNGETLTVEFKSWVNASSMKERVNLAVNELVAFANARGGTVYFGVEDNGKVTGCSDKLDTQQFIEAIYDKTRPPLFVEADTLGYEGKKVLSLTVRADGTTYATTDGKCLRRLGKNSKPYYPEEMSNKYNINQIADFSSKIIVESSENDINKLEIYKLKEKLKDRDETSTLPAMDDMAFLKDLGLIVEENGITKLTIAGLLFVGKEKSIRKMLPQAETIYLRYDESNLEEYKSRLDLKLPIISTLDRLIEKIQDYNNITYIQVGIYRLEISDFSEKVFQEALLNALAHRDYENMASVYVKHYPDKIVIENPGGFLDGINENNIITHASFPRNKLIAETLQHLRYVQRTGQGVDIIYRSIVSNGKPYPIYAHYGDFVRLSIYGATDNTEFVKFVIQAQEKNQVRFSLSELMILRYIVDNERIQLKQASILTQTNINETRIALNNLKRLNLIETVGNQYMLTSVVYDAVKTNIEYVQDKTINYLKAKRLVTEFLENENLISRLEVQKLCGLSDKQARRILNKMIDEKVIEMVKEGKKSSYRLFIEEND